MSNDSQDNEFFNRADEVIHLANQQCESAQHSKVSASLLYATARFNSFIVGSNASSAEEMEQDKDAAVQYFTEQYRKMLIENLDDYTQNFSKYVVR